MKFPSYHKWFWKQPLFWIVLLYSMYLGFIPPLNSSSFVGFVFDFIFIPILFYSVYLTAKHSFNKYKGDEK